jgi:hypothetical protein
MVARRASIRREARVARAASEVWDLVGDPARIQEWFPGIVASEVDGTSRVITTGSGIPMPEEIVTLDPLQRRFQYRIIAPMFREHLSTLDVVDLGDGTSLVVYSVDAEPSTMALVIGGAAGNAIDNVRQILEGAA